MGSNLLLKNAQKEDLFIQLSLILQTIEEPEIIDFEVWDKQLDGIATLFRTQRFIIRL
jgi:hypothetical protein